jgi:hypothetical protein
MASKEVVAVCTLVVLTFLPLGLNMNGVVVVYDFFPSNIASDYAVTQLQWFHNNNLDEYFQNMSNIYALFACCTVFYFLSSIPPASYHPDSSVIRTVLSYAWYGSCLTFLRGCWVIFPSVESCGLGIMLAVVGLMLCVQMYLSESEADSCHEEYEDIPHHPRVYIPGASGMKPASPSRAEEKETPRVQMGQQDVPLQLLSSPAAAEDEAPARGRTRRKTVAGKSSRSKSGGRSKSRGATKTPGRTRAKKVNDEYIY